MSTHEPTPTSPDGHEPLSDLFSDVLRLANQFTARISQDKVEARLRRVLRQSGHSPASADSAAPLMVPFDPATAKGDACRAVLSSGALAEPLEAQVCEMLQAIADMRHRVMTMTMEAQRTLHLANTARAQADEAREKAMASYAEAAKVMDEARAYHDAALERAASIVRDAKAAAEDIVRCAREAGQFEDDDQAMAKAAGACFQHVVDDGGSRGGIRLSSLAALWSRAAGDASRPNNLTTAHAVTETYETGRVVDSIVSAAGDGTVQILPLRTAREQDTFRALVDGVTRLRVAYLGWVNSEETAFTRDQATFFTAHGRALVTWLPASGGSGSTGVPAADLAQTRAFFSTCRAKATGWPTSADRSMRIWVPAADLAQTRAFFSTCQAKATGWPTSADRSMRIWDWAASHCLACGDVWQHARQTLKERTAADVMVPLGLAVKLTPATTVSEALEQVLQSSGPALPVFEGTRAIGVATLADLARRIHDRHGLPMIEHVETLMRPPVMLETDTPLSVVRARIADEGAGLLLVIASSGETVGYITAESLLTVKPAGHQVTDQPRAPLLLPSTNVLVPCGHI
jgi:CBS domain-containing protein